MASALRTLIVCCAVLCLSSQCHGLLCPPAARATRHYSRGASNVFALVLADGGRNPVDEDDDDDDDEAVIMGVVGEEERPPPLRRRRRIVLAAAPASLLLLLPRIADASSATAAETPAEALRLLAARTIPGLGPPDVYYPPYFVGRWKVTRVISDSDDEFWNNGVSLLPVRVVSEMRFVPYHHDSGSGGDFVVKVAGGGGGGGGDPINSASVSAIADRSFNERSYYDAFSEELDRPLYSATKKKNPPIRSSDWTPTDPNVLSLTYADGSSREIRVTKRSCDVSRDGDGLFSSEFRRITDVPPPPSSGPGSGGIGVGGIPRIYKSRVLTKWKRGGVVGGAAAAGGGGGGGVGVVNLIEGIEIVYNERGTLGNKNVDPLLGVGGGGGMGRNGAMPSPYGNDTKDLPDWRSTKTNILMERMI